MIKVYKFHIFTEHVIAYTHWYGAQLDNICITSIDSNELLSEAYGVISINVTFSYHHPPTFCLIKTEFLAFSFTKYIIKNTKSHQE